MTAIRPLDAAAAIELAYFEGRYDTLDRLITALTWDTEAALKAAGYEAEFGASNISSSTYLTVGEKRLRFADHRNVRSGECVTFRIDDAVKDVWFGFNSGELTYSTDPDALEDREYAGSEIDEADYRRFIAEALEAVL